jgi:hypothetical protein
VSIGLAQAASQSDDGFACEFQDWLRVLH